jgi:hypothetical protein
MNKTTIGRVVTIHSNKSNLFNGTVYDTSKPFAAIVTGVHDNGLIAVTVFPPGKDSFPIYEVPSIEGKEDGVAYWEWPVREGEERRSELNLTSLENIFEKNYPKGSKAREEYDAYFKKHLEELILFGQTKIPAQDAKKLWEESAPTTERFPADDEQLEAPVKKKPAAKAKTKKE